MKKELEAKEEKNNSEENLTLKGVPRDISGEIPTRGKINYSSQGKKNRAAGQRFEAKVRAKLEEMGWIVDKWTNTVDYDKWKLVPAKRKYNPFRKVMVIGTGFPDFIGIKFSGEEKKIDEFGEEKSSGKRNFEVIGVEVKMNGYLDKIEKDMCFWLLENRIFSKILIAKAKKEGRKTEFEYIDFQKKYNKA